MGPPSIFKMICDRMDEKFQRVPLARQFGPTSGFSDTVEKNILTL